MRSADKKTRRIYLDISTPSGPQSGPPSRGKPSARRRLFQGSARRQEHRRRKQEAEQRAEQHTQQAVASVTSVFQFPMSGEEFVQAIESGTLPTIQVNGQHVFVFKKDV